MVDAAKKESTALTNMTGKLEFAEDNMVLNEEFKKNVAIPYFKDIYKDLVSQSDSKSKGLNNITLLNVSHCLLYSISVCSSSTPNSQASLAKDSLQCSTSTAVITLT